MSEMERDPVSRARRAGASLITDDELDALLAYVARLEAPATPARDTFLSALTLDLLAQRAELPSGPLTLDEEGKLHWFNGAPVHEPDGSLSPAVTEYLLATWNTVPVLCRAVQTMLAAQAVPAPCAAVCHVCAQIVMPGDPARVTVRAVPHGAVAFAATITHEACVPMTSALSDAIRDDVRDAQETGARCHALYEALGGLEEPACPCGFVGMLSVSITDPLVASCPDCLRVYRLVTDETGLCVDIVPLLRESGSSGE